MRTTKELTIETMRELPGTIKEQAIKTFIAMAETEAVREIIDPIKREILAQNEYKTIRMHVRDEDPHIITDTKDTHRMRDEDFKEYLHQYQEGFEKAGFTDVPDNQCPLLIAESKEREAKRELVRAAEPLTGIGFNDVSLNLRRYREYIELLLSIASKEIEVN